MSFLVPLPFVGQIFSFFAFFEWLFGTPPLSAELRTGKAAATPRQVTNTANLRVLNFTYLPPWLY